MSGADPKMRPLLRDDDLEALLTRAYDQRARDHWWAQRLAEARAEHVLLHEDTVRMLRAEGAAEGAAARQAAIVAWLRDGAPPFASARGLADAIEAGAVDGGGA